MEKVKKNYSEIIYNLTKVHWIWYTIIISLPSIWFTFLVPIFGVSLHLKDENGNFSIGGIIGSIIVVTLSLIIAGFNNHYASKSGFGELEKLRGHIEYLEKITDSVDNICDEKYKQIRSTISQVKENRKSSPEIISRPSNQLMKILEQISMCLVTFMERPDEKYAPKDFFVTLSYNFPQENNIWRWVDGTIERGIALSELTGEGKNSTFNYIRNSKKAYYFNNKKEDAMLDGKYLYDSYDETNAANGKPVGSIFCYNFKICLGNITYVDAILSISTQQKRFAVENDQVKINNARDNTVRLVKEYFGRRISIELGLLYLDYLNK